MQFVIVFLLFGFVQPVQAITKCEFRGKVTYKKGNCPENSAASFLVKNKYIKEQDLQKIQQQRVLASEQALEQMLAPKSDSEVPLESEHIQKVSKRIKISNESVHFQLQTVEEFNNRTDKVYAPNRSEDLSGKLLDMERQVQERNKALQQLQKN